MNKVRIARNGGGREGAEREELLPRHDNEVVVVWP